jgi:hypothetical protein
LKSGGVVIIKIFIRTFPSAEECELFESILQTKWPELLENIPNVRFRAIKNDQTPHVSTVVWEFPDEATQKTIEQLISENITRFTQTLSPKTMTVTGKTFLTFGSIES